MRKSKWWVGLYFPAIFKGMWRTLTWMFRKKVTLQYPEEKHVPRPGYRGEHRLKQDPVGRMKCVACFMCATACPAECIYIEAGDSPWPDRDKIPVRFEIDMLKCIYCGMCEEACPCDAIELTPHYQITGLTRQEMIFDREKLLEVYDQTIEDKPM